MAIVAISMGGVESRDGAPVEITNPRVSESKTSSGSASSTTGKSFGGEYIGITSSGGAVWVSMQGIASAGNDYLIPDGATRYFFDGEGGNQVSVIDA